MIPLIGQKPQLPPVHVEGGFVEDKVWLQFAPVAMMTIEEAERIIGGLQAAVDRARVHREAVVTAIQANGIGTS